VYRNWKLKTEKDVMVCFFCSFTVIYHIKLVVICYWGSLFSGLFKIFFHAGHPAQERWSSGRATIGQAGWCSHKLI
jgi:hypothetical protein